MTRVRPGLTPIRLSVGAAVCLGLLAGAPEAKEGARDGKPAAAHASVSLDDLFARLKVSQDPAEAKGIAGLIERRLARSGSATADLLTERARQAMAADDVPLAVELMDRAMLLEPGWAEGWNRMATLFWKLSDPTSAIADLERALVIEPRHFEAWAALGKLYLASDDKARALDAFRRAEALYPQWGEVREAVGKLAPDVDGRDL